MIVHVCKYKWLTIIKKNCLEYDPKKCARNNASDEVGYPPKPGGNNPNPM